METFQEIIDAVMDNVRDPRLLQGGVSAQGTMTLTGLPLTGESFVIGSHTFTFKATRAIAGEVAIGADVDATLANIVTAINTDCDYFTAVANTTTDKVVISAVKVGSRIRPSDTAYGWNRVPFTESCTNLTLDGSGYFGGTTTGVWGNRVERAINQTLQRIAAGAWIDARGGVHNVFLPVLESYGTVTTSASVNYVALPTDYCKNLFRAYSTTRNQNISIFGSVEQLLRHFAVPDLGGAVEAVTVRNASTLYYQQLGAESLTIYYYKKPTLLTYHDDTPSCLPEHLAFPLLFHGACYLLWAGKEIGVDGQKVNTAAHLQDFNTRMGELVAFLGPPDKTPPMCVDETQLDFYMSEQAGLR